MDYITDALSNHEMGVVILAAIIVFLLFLAFFIHAYLPFKERRDYIKMELARACEEEESLYWKSELKMLYISKIPILRSIVRRKYDG